MYRPANVSEELSASVFRKVKKIVPVPKDHYMKMYGGPEMKLHTSLSSALIEEGLSLMHFPSVEECHNSPVTNNKCLKVSCEMYLQ
jgi:hypothetical protein